MSQGFLLFAHNNEEIDYGVLAAWTAKRISQRLDKPVSLVADAGTRKSLEQKGLAKYFDQIINSEVGYAQSKRYRDKQLSFHNYDRCNAWELTPYNETMIIDTDIVIQSAAMNKIWNNRDDLVVCRASVDAFDVHATRSEFLRLSDPGIDFYWATEFYFRKTEESRVFFETCKWVRSNYNWLRNIYGIFKLLRNDHIWSIALHELGGTQNATWCPTLPWTLIHVTDDVNIHSMTDTSITLYHELFGIRRIHNHDIHVMNKFDLVALAAKELNHD
jgi:hypothetical protein